MRKGDVRKLVSDHLVDENIVLEEEVEKSRDSLEMKRLEWQEKEKEQEAQLHMKELEIKEQMRSQYN